MLSREHTTCMDMMSVLERQAARFKWLQQQQQQLQLKDATHLPIMPHFQGIFSQVETGSTTTLPQHGGNHHLLLPSGFEFLAPPDQVVSHHPSLGIDHCLSRTSSCHMAAAASARAAPEEGEEDAVVVMMAEENGGRSLADGSNKRKTENEEIRGKKRVKGEMEVESSRSRSEETNCRGDSTQEETQKKKKKGSSSGDEKQDYIHVRARRGQATDSHSLAERARREKISRKMKCLQDLVPGCNKITGRAGMLDEIINYVQSLQRQVEFLSMKLAAVNPRMEFNSDKLSGKEFPGYPSFPTAMNSMFPGAASLAQLQQLAASREMENLTTNHSQISSEKTQTSSAFSPELCLDSSSFPQVQVHQPFWEADSQSFQDMGFHRYQG
ncbi:unnamed protein product [Linum trigynum]|uniref:BHLH domain-containing protein n=1 Tax=Linum trigynum TaxID=586398 RepID=A0AAV2CWD4_9ROSI